MSGPFDDLTFLRTTVKVTNTGDGLSQSMQVQVPDLRHRDVVHVLLECEVVDVQTPLVKDTDGNELKFVFKAGRATIVEGKAYDKALDEMSKRLEKAAGISRIPGIDGEDE